MKLWVIYLRIPEGQRSDEGVEVPKGYRVVGVGEKQYPYRPDEGAVYPVFVVNERDEA